MTTSLSEEEKSAMEESLVIEQVKARLASISMIAQAEAATKQSNLQSIQIGAQIDKANAMLNQMGQQPETPEMISQGNEEMEGQETPEAISPNPENTQSPENMSPPGLEVTQPLEQNPNPNQENL
jgi:outer membrane protein TolC